MTRLSPFKIIYLEVNCVKSLYLSLDLSKMHNFFKITSASFLVWWRLQFLFFSAMFKLFSEGLNNELNRWNKWIHYMAARDYDCRLNVFRMNIDYNHAKAAITWIIPLIHGSGEQSGLIVLTVFVISNIFMTHLFCLS